ncbi:MAG: sulfite exporter TauE/SafE family protein [Alphaproteobacteria bacterium]|nr:sulfite exporter TauE/SafE family protein [Alphaproteobacteria bacterium]
MHVYLPIAELSVNWFTLLVVGSGVGFLSGLFGVGGGFLMTPLLIFLGVPAPVAVGTGAAQILASSVSGVLAHWRRQNVDVQMGLALAAGGFVGSALGIWIFTLLRQAGQVDLVIRLCFVIFLGSVGGLMLVESVRTWFRRATTGVRKRKLHEHYWLHGLPFKLRFRRSKLYISALLPLTVGFAIGILTAIMGVGGGFILVPAMIYILGMPTQMVVGTSLFQTLFVAANVTILQSVTNQTVDVMLALLLIVGGVVGAQFGTRFGARLRGEQLRILLALLVLGVGLKLAFDLFTTPDDFYSLAPEGQG